MTLSPVFRSTRAVELLREQGVWERLQPAMLGQARAVETLYRDLECILDGRFLAPGWRLPSEGEMSTGPGLAFLQEYFFLILFRALFEALGVPPRRLEFYSELNFCIKGTITAADNLFDDQGKSLLPLVRRSGNRFLSILQLMSFERLLQRACDRAVAAGVMREVQAHAILRGLLTRMAEIGELEGSEEGGVEEIPTPEAMLGRVHKVRGGALFALAFVAPALLEVEELGEVVREAESAVARLGTAFQIVDDLTDFEFDLGRRSHNLLVSEAFHHGSPQERQAVKRFWEGAPVPSGTVEGLFRRSSRAVLERAYREAEASFGKLADLGFWLSPQLAPEVVHAIVGMDGVARMESLTASLSQPGS